MSKTLLLLLWVFSVEPAQAMNEIYSAQVEAFARETVRASQPELIEAFDEATAARMVAIADSTLFTEIREFAPVRSFEGVIGFLFDLPIPGKDAFPFISAQLWEESDYAARETGVIRYFSLKVQAEQPDQWDRTLRFLRLRRRYWDAYRLGRAHCDPTLLYKRQEIPLRGMETGMLEFNGEQGTHYRLRAVSNPARYPEYLLQERIDGRYYDSFRHHFSPYQEPWRQSQTILTRLGKKTQLKLTCALEPEPQAPASQLSTQPISSIASRCVDRLLVIAGEGGPSQEPAINDSLIFFSASRILADKGYGIIDVAFLRDPPADRWVIRAHPSGAEWEFELSRYSAQTRSEIELSRVRSAPADLGKALSSLLKKVKACQ